MKPIPFFILSLLLAPSAFPQSGKPYLVPTVVTAHYSKSEPKSHGLVTVDTINGHLTAAFHGLAKNTTYTLALLNETSGERINLGPFKTDTDGAASSRHAVKGHLPAHNALLLLRGEDIIQYAQLRESHLGCICKHSGGAIVTRSLDQDCYECPCGVKFEICCGGHQ